MTQKVTDQVKLFTTMLSTLLMFLTIIGVRFDWLTIESINAFGVFLTAFILFGLSMYGNWMNTFTRWESFRKAKRLEQQRLKEVRKG